MTSHLVVPDSFSDLMSTQMELHIKTPFAGFQNLDAQAILGRKEDKDVVALIGVYIENLQYSVTITGNKATKKKSYLFRNKRCSTQVSR